LKREFEAYFATPLAAVFLIIFLFSMGTFTFYVGHFYENGVADLGLFFGYQPWLYLFLIPALAMRLWAEEKRSGSIELLFTLPVPLWAAVLAKFLAAWIFIGLSLALTFPIWLTVNFLGRPDNGVILSAYLGSFLMAGAYLSIGAAVSAATRNQIIAFVVSVVVCFLFTMPGSSAALNFLENWLPLPMVQAIASFSFLAHFTAISAGVADLRDIIFFVSVIALFLFINILLIDMSHNGGTVLPGRAYTGPALTLSVLIFFAVNMIAASRLTHARIDFTEDGEYTLAQGTKSIITGLPQPVTLNLYYSRKEGTKYPAIAAFEQRVRDLLTEYASGARGKIIVREIDPEPFSPEEDQANQAGIVPTMMAPAEPLYFGLQGVNSVDQKQVIPVFSPSRGPTLEYELSLMLDELSHAVRPKLTVISSLPLAHAGQDGRPLMIYNQLQQIYDVTDLRPNFLTIPAETNVLLIVHPQGLGARQLKAIEHYTLMGGHVLVFVDPASEIVRRSGEGVPSSDLVPLLSGWGVIYNTANVVLDKGAAERINQAGDPNQPSTPYPIWLHLTKANFNPHDPITANLQSINLGSAGMLVPAKGASTHFEPLLFSTDQASLLRTDRALSIYDPAAMMKAVKPTGKRYTIAARISGRSVFPGVESGIMNIIVVADTDILDDRFWLRAGDSGPEPVADNASFVLDAMDNLSGSDALASLRSRGNVVKVFTRVRDMQAKADREFRQTLDNLKAELVADERTAAKLEQGTAGSLTPEHKAEMDRIGAQIADTRKRLRQVQHDLTASIDQLGILLAFLNIAMVPLLISAFAIGLGVVRRRRAATPMRRRIATNH
jgi:ABC-type uncharacterized transport system involved in gliding motility auxiliary subunit/ABC-type transport system involved in multi-copper enzyme maturation permease subunit